MLVFIIAVKHPERSNSYERVTEILRKTLLSVEAQSNSGFATIIVCNKRPMWARDATNRLFIEVDFPPAAAPANIDELHSWSYIDKGAKNAVGLVHAKDFNPTHVMFVDADDFVSRRLAEHVSLNARAPGWYFDRGLLYSGQFKIAEVRDRFWSYCGTSHILRFDLLPVQLEFNRPVSRDCVLKALDRFYVQRILGSHLDFIPYVSNMGLELAPLPFFV